MGGNNRSQGEKWNGINNPTEKKIRQKVENEKQLAIIRDEMVAQCKSDLPNRLENKTQELVKQMSAYGGERLTALQINSLVRANSITGFVPKYSADEMNIVYEAYVDMITMVNKKLMELNGKDNVAYLPTKQNFCGFAGITTNIYTKYLMSDNEYMREVMQKIDDYITDTNLSMAQANQVNAIPTMFRAKTEHGYVEAIAPIQIEHKRDVDVGSILNKIEQIKKNKTLKTVEIKGDYTVE